MTRNDTTAHEDAHWFDQAACRDHPVDFWFPTRDDPDNLGLTARHICASCPVRTECLIENLNQDHGVWGGAGEQRRRALRRARSNGPAAFRAALDTHFAVLDGQHIADRAALSSVGEHATHGKRGTYAKGDRCQACSLATSHEGARKKFAAKGTAA